MKICLRPPEQPSQKIVYYKMSVSCILISMCQALMLSLQWLVKYKYGRLNSDALSSHPVGSTGRVLLFTFLRQFLWRFLPKPDYL